MLSFIFNCYKLVRAIGASTHPLMLNSIASLTVAVSTDALSLQTTNAAATKPQAQSPLFFFQFGLAAAPIIHLEPF